MAEKLNIPNEVVNSAWRDDVDVDYATYGKNDKEEMEYISPQQVSEETEKKLEEIKSQIIKFRARRGGMSRAAIAAEGKLAA